MNDENLKKGKATQFRSGEMAASNGRKGGLAYGKKRRDERDARNTLKALLCMPMTNARGDALISPITGEKMSVQETLLTTAIEKAIKGSYRHLQLILDVLGELAPKRIDAVVSTTIEDNRSIEEIHTQIRRLMQSELLSLPDHEQQHTFEDLQGILFPIEREEEPSAELLNEVLTNL